MKLRFPDIGMDTLMDMRVTLNRPSKMTIILEVTMMDMRTTDSACRVNLAT